MGWRCCTQGSDVFSVPSVSAARLRAMFSSILDQCFCILSFFLPHKFMRCTECLSAAQAKFTLRMLFTFTEPLYLSVETIAQVAYECLRVLLRILVFAA